MPLRALARVNLAAIERNVAQLRAGITGGTQRRAGIAGGAQLYAVVKGNGYGHGAVPTARAALAGGAAGLAVATAGEAAELRAAGIVGPLLVMGAVSTEELPEALAARAELVAWSAEFVAQLAAAAATAARSAPGPGGAIDVHVKLDTGMGRLGTRDPREAQRVAEAVQSAPALRLTGAMTHLATSDDDLEFVAEQLRAFAPFAAELRRRVPGIRVHAANSGAVLREPASHHDLVRTGIAIYGCDPMHEDPRRHGLEPALELLSYVAAVKRAQPGQSAGYGRRFVAASPTMLATLPIGYADGVRRALTNNCDVLIGGRRYPLVGTVSMDNITVDLGPETAIAVGAVATLIGVDGSERQSAEDLARRIGTINYEILCGISARVPRRYHRDGEPA
jgi:alanine racemase